MDVVSAQRVGAAESGEKFKEYSVDLLLVLSRSLLFETQATDAAQHKKDSPPSARRCPPGTPALHNRLVPRYGGVLSDQEFAGSNDQIGYLEWLHQKGNTLGMQKLLGV
jgi:hypothetical protein